MQGGKGMKKVAISGIIVILVIFGIGMSYMLFRGGRRTEEEQKISEEGEKRMENLMKLGQESDYKRKLFFYSKLMERIKRISRLCTARRDRPERGRTADGCQWKYNE